MRFDFMRVGSHPKKALKTTFVVLRFMALEIIKNGLAKNKIRGPFRPRGEGGQDEMVPGPFQNTFLFSNPSLTTKL